MLTFLKYYNKLNKKMTKKEINEPIFNINIKTMSEIW